MQLCVHLQIWQQCLLQKICWQQPVQDTSLPRIESRCTGTTQLCPCRRCGPHPGRRHNGRHCRCAGLPPDQVGLHSAVRHAACRQAWRGTPPAVTCWTAGGQWCPPCRDPQIEASLRGYFGSSITEHHLKLAETPQGRCFCQCRLLPALSVCAGQAQQQMAGQCLMQGSLQCCLNTICSICPPGQSILNNPAASLSLVHELHYSPAHDLQERALSRTMPWRMASRAHFPC